MNLDANILNKTWTSKIQEHIKILPTITRMFDLRVAKIVITYKSIILSMILKEGKLKKHIIISFDAENV